MKKKAAIVILASLLFLGCQTEGTKDSSKVLKKVGTLSVTENDYKEEIENIPAQYKSYYETEEGKIKIIEELSKQKMFYLEAKELGLDKSEEYKIELEKAKERTLAGILLKEKIMNGIELSDEELNAEYEKVKENYKIEEKAKASHILIKANDKMPVEAKAKAKLKAEEILKKALAGEDFAELAKAESEGPSASRGGDLGEFGRGRMVPPFEKAIFSGEAGKVYPQVVETNFGYHIIKIEERIEAGYKSLEEVKPEIEGKLLNEKRKEVYDNYIKKLNEKYLEKEEKVEEKLMEKTEEKIETKVEEKAETKEK